MLLLALWDCANIILWLYLSACRTHTISGCFALNRAVGNVLGTHMPLMFALYRAVDNILETKFLLMLFFAPDYLMFNNCKLLLVATQN